MTLLVKLCGLSTPRDVEVAVEAGADAIGLVMTPSPRQVSVAQAARLRAMLPAEVMAVAVFHSPSSHLVRQVQAEVSPDLFQATPDALTAIDGSLTLPVVVDGPDLEQRAAAMLEHSGATRLLLDTAPKGGTGQLGDWSRLSSLSLLPHMFLAGGLDAGNVGEALRRFHPGGVDVSSGVERAPGVKDHGLMRAFVDAARAADAEEAKA